MQSDPYNLSQAESVIPFSVFLLAFGISFAFSGVLTDRRGPRQPAFIGAVLLGVGYILCYSISMFPADTLGITVLAFGFIGGIGCGFAYNPPIAAVGRWFPDKRGLALGLTVMGFGLSALITAPVVTALVSYMGLANTFLALGAFFLVLLSLLSLFMTFPPPEWKAPSSSASQKSKPWCPSTIEFSCSHMVRTSTFYVTWLIFLFGAGAGLMVIGYAKPVAETITGLEGDLSWLAVIVVSVLAVSNAFGRPLFGSICDRIGPRKTLLIMQGIQLLCLVGLFPYSNSIVVLYLSTILFAATFGAYLSVMPALAGYFFGTKNLGPNYGMYLSAYGVGGVVCPMVMAAVVGSTPTYATYVHGFYVTAVLIVMAILLSLLMKTPKPPKSS
jgi:MFS family permease